MTAQEVIDLYQGAWMDERIARLRTAEALRQSQAEVERLTQELAEATAGTLTIVEKDHATGS